MRAISVRQPWASLIIYGYGGVLKDIENRDWPLPQWMWGKRCAIHSSAKRYEEEFEAARNVIRSRHLPWPDADLLPMPFGHILGSVEFVRNVTESESPWFFGPNGFLMREPIALPEPVPAKGALGLWNWNPEVRA